MHSPKTLFTVLAAVSVSIAQSVNISGKVTDTTGTALPGATVWLEKDGLTATTGADGNFTLSGIISMSNRINQSLSHHLSATVHNGLLYLTVAKMSAVEIKTFNLNGRALSTMQQTLDVGTHSIVLPYYGAGIYLYKVKSGNNEFMLKCNSIGGVSQGTAVSVKGSSSYNAVAKQTKVTAAINDVIAVTKTGYLNYRVIVTNSDTSGIEIKMIVSAGTVTDTDGNVYQTVKIGNQVWTVENLRTTKYNDGTPITFDTSKVTWANATTEKYCYYNNTTDVDSIKKFGALYNCYAVATKMLAPPGWHVPADGEWDTLQNYLVANGYNYDGTTSGNKIAKSMEAKADWYTSSSAGAIGADLTKNNRSGFSALPGGFRYNNGAFVNIGNHGFWWTAPDYNWDGACRYLLYGYEYLVFNRYDKSCGMSVRLLRDN